MQISTRLSAAVLTAVCVVSAAPPRPSAAQGQPVLLIGEAVKLEEFGVNLRLPGGWTRAKPEQTPPDVMARFLGPASSPDSKLLMVMDLTAAPLAEGQTVAAARDRMAEGYRKGVKGAQVAPVREVATAGMPGWELRMTFRDAKDAPASFAERSWVVGGNRVYSLRMAAAGSQADALAGLLDAVAGSVEMDRRLTEVPDAAGFRSLAGQLKKTDLRTLLPLEQHLLAEAPPAKAGEAPKPVGSLYLRFEKARFEGREGWFLRVRSLQVPEPAVKIRQKAWTFVTEDWSRESWSATVTQEGADGVAKLLLEETGTRDGDKVTVKYKTEGQPEKTETFTVPANYLPAAVEPAFTVLASRADRGEFAFALHEPGLRSTDYVLTPGRRDPAGRTTSVERRAVGQTVSQNQMIDPAGRTLSVEMPQQPPLKAVDKATLLRIYPDAADLK